jgi:hypothetical protein
VRSALSPAADANLDEINDFARSQMLKGILIIYIMF